MSRREIREQIFKILFQTEFYGNQEWEEHLQLSLKGLGELREKDSDYITAKVRDIYQHLSEIDETVRKAIRFIPVETVSTVLENALCSLPHPRVAVPAALTHEEADPKGEVKNFELNVPKSEPVERPLVRR